jgi:hypothetical protein
MTIPFGFVLTSRLHLVWSGLCSSARVDDLPCPTGILARPGQSIAHLHTLWQIEFQEERRNATDGSQGNDPAACKLKMLVPSVHPRVKERYQFTTHYIT